MFSSFFSSFSFCFFLSSFGSSLFFCFLLCFLFSFLTSFFLGFFNSSYSVIVFYYIIINRTVIFVKSVLLNGIIIFEVIFQGIFECRKFAGSVFECFLIVHFFNIITNFIRNYFDRVVIFGYKGILHLRNDFFIVYRAFLISAFCLFIFFRTLHLLFQCFQFFISVFSFFKSLIFLINLTVFCFNRL
ncbi:hypothetical protein DWX26_05475 [Blautia sp. AF19-1]|nr:hypothetical protein DWX26_05475 [Blautia sp. AF19-1]